MFTLKRFASQYFLVGGYVRLHPVPWESLVGADAGDRCFSLDRLLLQERPRLVWNGAERREAAK